MLDGGESRKNWFICPKMKKSYNLKKERMLIDNNGIFTVSLAELR